MESYEKEQLVSTTVRIKSRDIYKTKNIDSLIKYNLISNKEGYCGKYGYVISNSIQIIKRSYGKTVISDGRSDIEYDLTYKMKVILPCKGDKYKCIIENITKMGIIAYISTDKDEYDNIKSSPILIIIPQEYIISKDISDYVKGQKIDVEILDIRIKYRSKQIQSVGKIE